MGNETNWQMDKLYRPRARSLYWYMPSPEIPTYFQIPMNSFQIASSVTRLRNTIHLHIRHFRPDPAIALAKSLQFWKWRQQYRWYCDNLSSCPLGRKWCLRWIWFYARLLALTWALGHASNNSHAIIKIYHKIVISWKFSFSLIIFYYILEVIGQKFTKNHNCLYLISSLKPFLTRYRAKTIK